MSEYHPIRYIRERTEIDRVSKDIDASLAELAAKFGRGTPDFITAADRLIGGEIQSGDDFLSLVRRSTIMDHDHEQWWLGEQTIFDLNILDGGDLFRWDDAHLMKFEIPDENFYLHFGPEAGFHLKRHTDIYFDGIYVRSSTLDGHDGLAVTFVCQQGDVTNDPSYCSRLIAASRIAYSWVPFGQPISQSIKSRGIAGDPELLVDQALLRLIDSLDEIIFRLCAAEHTMTFASQGMRH